MVVYIDLIFITNLLIDGALLWLTAWMRKLKPPWWRLIVAAVVGALYVVMMFVPQLSFMYTFLVKLGLSLLMLWITFGFGSLQNYIRNMGAFYIINFAVAGGIIGIHYLLQNSGEIFNGIWFTASGGMSFELKIGFWFTFIGVFGMLLWFKMVHSTRKQVESRSVFMGEVAVEIGGHRVTCRGLLDTGNQLSDPLTRTPVMVMEASLWADRLPSGWCERLADGEPDKLVMELEHMDFAWQDRLRLVPYRGVNRSASFMLAIKPDAVEVRIGDGVHRSSKVLVGLDGGQLSGDRSYQAIIHPKLVEDDAQSPAAEPLETAGNL
ncbi:sigma-E processing peptidase SpoIIGA [Paenibacillus cellulositrophicus]|uniref:sigma-E processing peptidase SpoIIGA n=1 Tax=Paenibacillus TaxID=44249 RepID=UPI000E21EE3A|nr:MULTISPECIES: sigma-E processing peptidase SpoIIGA [Paenibacillus]MCM2999627.1 sigma-E processing peptidase SpoIIGA [Paenibacillus cellulositrophicus]